MTPDEEFSQYAGSRWPQLVRSAVFLGARPADAEDVAQGVLAQVWRSWHRVSQAEDPDAYVYRMLVNHLNSLRRRRWVGEQPTDQHTSHALVDQTAPAPDGAVTERDQVLRVLAALPAEQRQVLVLRYIADLSERQAAAALGVATGTVKSRASRGLSAIRTDHLVEES